jgi:hypothetical protein
LNPQAIMTLTGRCSTFTQLYGTVAPVSRVILTLFRNSGDRSSSNTPRCEHSWTGTRTSGISHKDALRSVVQQLSSKPKPPSISVCSGDVCLDHLRWVRPDISSLPSISGLLIDYSSTATLRTVSLEFSLISGRVLAGATAAFFSSEIPPGARWYFTAYFSEYTLCVSRELWFAKGFRTPDRR